MESSKPGDLDSTIETALSTEPLRRPPAGFFGRIKRRLAVIALIQQERRSFRYSMTAGGTAFLGVLTVLFLSVYIGSLPSRLAWYVPGGMGFLDYVKTQFLLSTRMVFALIGLAAAVPLGAMLFTFVRPPAKPAETRRTESGRS